MSESSDKLITVSRRQPVQRRRQRQVPKTTPKRTKNQPASATAASPVVITRLNNISPPTIPTGGRKSRTKVVVPQMVKTIPAKGRVAPPQSSLAKVKTVRVPKSGMAKIDKRPSRKTRLKPMARTLLYALRLLIVGVGMGAIVGTLLSIFDPANRLVKVPTAPNGSLGQVQNVSNPNSGGGLSLSQEIAPLKNALQNLVAANPKLTPGVFFVDLDTGEYVDINANNSFPAASTIKIPILIAFFQDVDAGKIRLDEMLIMQKEAIASGSGNFQYKPVGTQFTALEVATKMITISDNTATNMLITKLGGIDAVNERFRTWGLANTAMRNKLPDLAGTNTTSPQELGNLMAMVNQGNFLSMRSRDLMLDIMRRTERDTLLPSGLETGAKAYHKTGDIGTMLGDAGLIDIPTGKRYIAAIMVQRPKNDPSAEKLISSISRAAYQHFSKVAVTPSTPVNPVNQINQVNPVNQVNQVNNNPPLTSYQPPMQAVPVQPMIQPGMQPMIQPPIINPVIPGGTVNTMPMGTYPAPGMNPQYYPPQ
ncbi:MAG TPA: serine hydrolase [Nostocaceae cyanobacterium]|nr:serine hydrolase [Nostocaceae cyanobacterium]